MTPTNEPEYGRPGPRGEKGDRGEKGETGAAGVDHGAKGNQGNQGNQGFKGESVSGERGRTGAAGTDGVDGHDGIQGKRGKDSLARYAVIAIFIVVSAVILGYAIQRDKAYALEQCNLRRTAVIHQNQTWQKLTEVERLPITTTPASQKRIELRIKIFDDAQVPVPECT